MDNELIREKNWWQKYWKWLTAIALAGVLFICFIAYASSGLKAAPEQQTRFDSVKWKTKKGLDYPYRLNMLNELLSTDTLRNASKEQILEWLGKPDQTNEFYLYYTVAQKRIGTFPINTKSLVISLSKDGGKHKVMSHG